MKRNELKLSLGIGSAEIDAEWIMNDYERHLGAFEEGSDGRN